MSKIEAQLRQELAQITAALEETDEALDEWIAETERLQEVIKSKDKECKTLMDQMDELRQHSLKIVEEYQAQQRSAAAIKPPSPSSLLSPQHVEKITAEWKRKHNEVSEQLNRAQLEVAEGLSKLSEAQTARQAEEKKRTDLEKKFAQIESERDEALWHKGRLMNVVHALELELGEKRALSKTLKGELEEARADVGKYQAFNTVHQFKLHQATMENDLVASWMKSIVRWSSKL